MKPRYETTSALPPHGSQIVPGCCRGCRYLTMIPAGPVMIVPGCTYLVFDLEPARMIRQGQRSCRHELDKVERL